METETLRQLHKVIDALTKANAELRSRCDALEVGMCYLAGKLGIKPEAMIKAISDEEHRLLLERQIKIEDSLGPTEASRIFEKSLQPPSSGSD